MNPELNTPVTIVIFGATGDLSQKKLLPSLMDLFCKGLLPSNVRIVAFARQERTTENFQEFVREKIAAKAHQHPETKVDEFIETISYCKGDFTSTESFHVLEEYLTELDRKRGLCTNKLLYLAVPPSLYGDIFESVAASGLEKNCADENWVRIAVEKPFGNDLETAKNLDVKLCSLFSESQIFRIDHYLGKSALENILAFRFSNSMFEPIWNAKHIERIHVKLYEKTDVATRGAFFDSVGQLRDVGQNHVLQMLALATMDDPGVFAPERVRAEREKALRSLQVKEGGRCEKKQYNGYASHEKVSAQSRIDTYFYIEAELASERWKGVPIVLESGKNMERDLTEVEVVFKAKESCVCSSADVAMRHNSISFRVQPDPAIVLRLWMKQPGLAMHIEERSVEFPYLSNPELRLPDAYEKILYDAIVGDQTIFTTGQEVEAAWEFITPILRKWDEIEPQSY